MNQPLLRLVLFSALGLAASAQADSLLPRLGAAAGGDASQAADGCTGTLRAGGVVGGETRVIFHDGSHAPISLPMTSRDEAVADSASAVLPASSSPAYGGGGGASPIALPSAEPSKPRSGPRWQTFLPGSLK